MWFQRGLGSGQASGGGQQARVPSLEAPCWHSQMPQAWERGRLQVSGSPLEVGSRPRAGRILGTVGWLRAVPSLPPPPTPTP